MGSSDIKSALAAATGIAGSGKDWKRRAKSRNLAGLTERVFEHVKTGQLVLATEQRDGSFTARILEGDFTAAAETSKESRNRARAGKYCFALGVEDDGIIPDGHIVIIISPVRYFEKTGYCYDQPSHLEDLLADDADDINECGTYVMERQGKTDLEWGIDLIARGFVWRADFQDLIYPKLDAASRKVLGDSMAGSTKKAAKNNPSI